MAQDCIATLHQLLGKPAGAEFSSEDVSLLFSKVFHVPSNSREAHAAMKKVAGHNNCWSCADGNLLDVLVEMEKEREKKEMFLWDFQLLNSSNLHQMMDYTEQSTDPKHAYNSEPGFMQIHTSEKNCAEERTRTVTDEQEFCDRDPRGKRLRKTAWQCWAKLASEGVKSMLPPPWQSQNTSFRAQSWGCVTLSDVLLLVEVKYDVVKQLLFTEMLQEHHTNNVWEKLLPWQKQKEMEMQEKLAEEALESADLICLAMLPGAFRMYKARLDASEPISRRSTEQCWTAVSLLNEIQTLCRREQHTLTDLTPRLCSEDPILMCLHIRLAILKAQRENVSYSCLLAAQQSWETWPIMSSPCRAEQVALWLDGEQEEEEEKEDLQTLQQKAALQLLVLSQEQERKHLIRMMRDICQEESQGSDCETLSKENSEQVTLRDGCLKSLKQIRAQLQAPSEEVQAHLQLQDCAPPMLTRLTELQEVQALTLLQALADRNPDGIQALRDKYINDIQTQRFSSLLHLLNTDFPDPNLTDSSSKDQSRPRSSCSSDEEHMSKASAEAAGADSVKRELNEVPAAEDKKELCSGCGAVIEDLPYLEISCSSNEQAVTPDVEAHSEESSAAATPDSCEKQESLITLAWSKATDCDTADAANVETGQSPDVKGSEMTPILPAQSKETVQRGDGGGQKSALAPCDAQSEEQGTTVEEREKADRDVEGDTSEKDQKMCAKEEEDVQNTQGEFSGDADDLDSGRSSLIVDAGREMSELEKCQTESKSDQCDLEEPSKREDVLHQESETECMVSVSKPEGEQTLVERERTAEPVSVMEREKTMRNLVDIQRKVEQKQQRDKERQMLRVQERLSIIQNRKAEGDLLGVKAQQTGEKRYSPMKETRPGRKRLFESDWSRLGESAPASCSPNGTGILQGLRNCWLQWLITRT
ncbi:hypothetical protein OJAV_G00056500 [Oryzias javanicus]|uniref:Uncharacterized protein n=1 Tax=Oryzias javanicus TaxID=123683 RepID=A0A3S2MBG4_ORYJA|nr:hypothetical protein OJAV_G00056500 [Oryzias javanicus]